MEKKIESLIVGIAIEDIEGKLIYVNPSFLKIWGYNNEKEILGKDGIDFWQKEDDASEVLKALQEKGIWSGEIVVKRKDGTFFNIHATASMIINEGDNSKEIITSFVDITKFKKKEKKLKEIKEKDRSITEILDHIGIGIDIVNINYKILFQNNTLKKRFGNIIGNLCYEKYMGVKEPCVFCPMIKAIKSNNIESVELIGIDGKNYELISAPFPNSDGTVDKVVEIVLDITDRKKAEEKLRKSEEKYRALFETSRDGIGFVALDGKFEEVNEALIKIFGYTHDEFKSMRFQELTPKKWQKMEAEIITNQIMTRGYSEVYEKEAIRKDGTIIPVALRAWLVKDEQGNPKRMMGILRDITDRKEFERKLKESEEKYRTLTEQSLMGIAIAQNNKFKYMNDTYSKICGYTIKEVEQWTIKDLKKIIHPDDYDFIFDQFQKKQRGDIDAINNYQYRAFKKNGEMVWVDNYSKSIIYEGKPADLITVIDITDRKKAEDALIESEEKYRKISERYQMLLDSITDVVCVI
ncbi:MAG: PAS domain S-box protein, partial [Promethearchaeota archaeon]